MLKCHTFQLSKIREPGKDRATSIAGHSPVQSSFRLTVENYRPSVRVSMMKSSDPR